VVTYSRGEPIRTYLRYWRVMTPMARIAWTLA
jgi:hypothetical protein